MTFIGPYHGPKMLGKKSKPTAKATLAGHQEVLGKDVALQQLWLAIW